MSTEDPAPAWTPRRAYRDGDAPLLGGVASGLATHLGVPVLGVRAAFVLLAALSGLGVLLYGALWAVLPPGTGGGRSAGARGGGFADGAGSTPGGDAADRTGRRPAGLRRLADDGPSLALAALALGLVLAVQGVLGAGAVFWPLALGLAGVALLWRQADEVQRERWRDASDRIDPVRAIFGRGGWEAWARVAAGAVLVLVALGVVGFGSGSLVQARAALLAGLLAVVGIAVVVGPWVVRLATDLGAEREERIRSQERADVAAHLHDSVLQTLALIQRSAGDPVQVARLARAQERDLRAWLYAGSPAPGGSLAAELRAVAAEAEDAHGVHVEVVVVGPDEPVDDRLRPLVAAAREAVGNAARHAGVPVVDVYAEVAPAGVPGGRTEVFVRDRGRGFDLAAVPDDRHGVRRSILDRMERHGGTASVRSEPGWGTEVRLVAAPRQEEER